jgi:hypothetical protein
MVVSPATLNSAILVQKAATDNTLWALKFKLYNFHVCHNVLFFKFFNSLKTIFSLKAVQKQAVGHFACSLVCGGLPWTRFDQKKVSSILFLFMEAD